ncbi:APC family permease [Cryptosporangium aurantiacum]|uniref:Amino acid/polyamine/organocation transporter, APC superfamily n=1 Tax=Cryptosporangium aurantiacum TaxID=134849 RepID=A0A1M7R0Q1_9ACTN|nr:APC family permease [Cryptosporangium aurantiacum]SHN38096.1 amino acid/polyamine/organocation transporter, APC superfamily [Cryptosporangium aurantiacum]
MTAERTTPSSTTDSAPSEHLAANRLGITGIVFFVVAAAAPLVGMTGAVPVAIVLGNGAAAPGAYLVAGLVLLVFSVGYAAMSHRVTNTGAFFAFVGRGLGITAGVGSAFVSLLAYVAVQLAVYGFFGAVAHGQLDARLSIDLPWWAWSLIAWAVVLTLSLLRVDIGAKVLGVLMGLEVLSLLLVAAVVLLQGGGPDGLSFAASFSPANIFTGGFGGSAGIALAFAFASYIGFEATAIYAEETKDPKRAVPRATYTAVAGIAVLFALASWAVVSGVGSANAVDRVAEISSVEGTPLADPSAVLFFVAEEYVGGWLATLMSWLVLSSLFAGLLAFQNSAARYFFSMGRAGVLPRALDRVNRRGAPVYGSVATSVITLLVIVFFAVTDKDPVLNLFNWFSGLAVLAIVLVEILVSVAVIVHFRREPGEAGVLKTVVAPAVAIVGLALAAYLIMARFGLLAGTSSNPDDALTAFALSATGWTLVLAPFVVLIIGLIIGAVRRNSENEDAIADFVS